MKLNVDVFVVRDNRVFAYGWAFSSNFAIVSARMVLGLVDGSSSSLPLTYGKERADVAEVFPEIPYASFSGWMTYAAWDGAAPFSASFSALLEDGTAVLVPMVIPLSDGVLPAVPPAAPPTLAERTMRRLAIIGRRVSGVPDAPSPAPVASFMAPAGSATAAYVMDCVLKALSDAGQPSCSFLIDHDMGGGANHYRKTWMQSRRDDRPVALVLSFHVASLRYLIDIDVAGETQRHFLGDAEIVAALAQSGCVDEVFYNDAVSFPRPGDVPSWLLMFKRNPRVALTLAVHDYFVVCPSQFLLNDEGRFCRIPDVTECLRCLPVNDNEFATLFTARSIPEWRRLWAAVLLRADEIICFSSSTRSLLIRAYPELAHAPVLVQPHVVEPFHHRPSISLDAPLHIGVVGAIGMHKGAGVLQALAAEIARCGLPIRITVIGSVELPCDVSVLQTTGSFQRSSLPDLIQRSGANVFLMPSICPETFSYVTQELMSLQVPLACFDLGAPAERVADYSQGLVLPWEGPSSLLAALQQFHQSLGRSQQNLS